MASTGAVASASLAYTQDTFMKLLVAQLKNQNPMEPMDNTEFTTQLAQMGQLEQLTTLNSNFEQYLRGQELLNAKALIGARVRYTHESGNYTLEGTVSGARLDGGQVKLVVGNALVPLSSVVEILPQQEAAK